MKVRSKLQTYRARINALRLIAAQDGYHFSRVAARDTFEGIWRQVEAFDLGSLLRK
ncbi:MAG: hypothetical protein OXF03_04060 [Gammaproteobacteria bacterium]|nr:hypothetical protein [Gammaproteobacteria bacterium]